MDKILDSNWQGNHFPLAEAFIAIGSNIEPETNITKALIYLKKFAKIRAVSNFFMSPAADRPEQPDFLNGVVKIETVLPPKILKFTILRRIEVELGRTRQGDKYASRTIDLDLILYGNLVLNEPELKLPDPYIRGRNFITVPLLELAPNIIIPDDNKPLAPEPAAQIMDGLVLQNKFSKDLRKTLLEENTFTIKPAF